MRGIGRAKDPDTATVPVPVGVSTVATLVVLGVVVSVVPWSQLLSSMPPSGTDLASHFDALRRLADAGGVRSWDARHLAGEPLFVHYPVLPFLAAALLGRAVPLEAAFDVVVLLPLVLLPFCVRWGLRRLGGPSTLPTLGFAAAAVFELDESYDRWGGNALSTAMGQFCHGWALCLLFVALGLLVDDFRRGRGPWRSAAALAGVVLCHPYVALPVPLLMALLVATHARGGGERARFLRHLFVAGLGSLVLSAWWLVPALQNGPWTAQLAGRWLASTPWRDLLPAALRPLVLVGGAALLTLAATRRGRDVAAEASPALAFAAGALAVWALCVPMNPRLGLLDVRAMPQVYLGLGLLSAAAIAALIAAFAPARLGPRSAALVAIALVAFAGRDLHRTRDTFVQTFSPRTRQPLGPDLERLGGMLASMGATSRVAPEASKVVAGAGSDRAMELVPSLSGRPVLESLYLQANPLSPLFFHFLSLQSSEVRCQFPEGPCAGPDVGRAVHLAPLFGVDTFVSSTPAQDARWRSSPDVEHVSDVGPFTVFRAPSPATLVEAPAHVAFAEGARDEWRSRAESWYLTWTPATAWTLDASFLGRVARADLERAVGEAPCRPAVAEHAGGLTLTTDCPGRLHVLKYAYHPTFRSESGEPLLLALPGYLALVPEGPTTTLTFGRSSVWHVADALSSLAWLILAGLGARSLVRWRRTAVAG